MHFHILTLMPKALMAYFQESILGKAFDKGIIKIDCHDLRQYATDKHKRVDDRPYGGGSGMVLKPDVIVNAVQDIKEKHPIDRVIAMSPRGPLFHHQEAQKMAQLKSILLLCGRYEGIDQRALDLVVDSELSIGDYVLTGGELAAQVVVDSVSRFIPGVLGNDKGTIEESHSNGLLEYPHYTRPDEFQGLKVPEVLQSGHHEEIKKWRHGESLEITKRNRPDLVQKRKKQK